MPQSNAPSTCLTSLLPTSVCLRVCFFRGCRGKKLSVHLQRQKLSFHFCGVWFSKGQVEIYFPLSTRKSGIKSNRHISFHGKQSLHQICSQWKYFHGPWKEPIPFMSTAGTSLKNMSIWQLIVESVWFRE